MLCVAADHNGQHSSGPSYQVHTRACRNMSARALLALTAMVLSQMWTWWCAQTLHMIGYEFDRLMMNTHRLTASAKRRPDPPRTRMHRISRAPVLSATLRRDSCWITMGLLDLDCVRQISGLNAPGLMYLLRTTLIDDSLSASKGLGGASGKARGTDQRGQPGH